jgi:hypothetical protein
MPTTTSPAPAITRRSIATTPHLHQRRDRLLPFEWKKKQTKNYLKENKKEINIPKCLETNYRFFF